MSQAKHADSTRRLHITSVSYAEDAELVELGAEFARLRVEFLAIINAPYDEAACARAATLGKVQRRIATQMACLIAVSEAGLRAKAAVLLAAAHRNPAGGLAWNSLSERLGQSLALDLLGPAAAEALSSPVSARPAA